jgi:hypothetical protein
VPESRSVNLSYRTAQHFRSRRCISSQGCLSRQPERRELRLFTQTKPAPLRSRSLVSALEYPREKCREPEVDRIHAVGLHRTGAVTDGKNFAPKFEVTSIKPNKSPDLSKGGLQLLPGGRFVATNIPLIQVIAAAWNLPLQSQRLPLASGVRMPDDIYDIEATAQKGAFPPGLSTEARLLGMRLMLQALLEDRFMLRIRREPKQQPVYALVVAKDSVKPRPSHAVGKSCNRHVRD